jgi:hypothetical protein
MERYNFAQGRWKRSKAEKPFDTVSERRTVRNRPKETGKNAKQDSQTQHSAA